jgi:hypothetical protein
MGATLSSAAFVENLKGGSSVGGIRHIPSAGTAKMNIDMPDN